MINKIKYWGFIFLICTAVSGQSVNTKQPNILWISIEDISPDLGCYGDKLAKTPVLDELAKKGFRYTNAIATAPVCAPARNSIITGMYPTSTGGADMRTMGKLPKNVLLYPEILRKQGYYCTNNVKEDYNLDLKRNIWDESSTSAHWKNRPSPETPFFAIFNLTLTHESCINNEVKHNLKTKNLPEDLRINAKDVTVPPYFPDTPVVRELLARHYDNISEMDRVVGGLLEELKQNGLSENTIVFFYSDHGTGLPRHKRWLFDTGVKVPFIVYIPEAFKYLYPTAPGKEQDRLISFVDLAPTVLNLANITIPRNMQGQAFLGKQLKAEKAYVFIGRGRMDERYDMQRGVRTKKYKYIRYYEPNKPFIQFMNTPESGPLMTELRIAEKAGTLSSEAMQLVATKKPKESLFDLENDPDEFNDLALNQKYKKELLKLRGVHEQWMFDVLDVGLIPEPILRDWEVRYNASIYDILRKDSTYYKKLLLMSSSNDEEELNKGLAHENEAVRYWAANGISNLHSKPDSKLIKKLKLMLRDQNINVAIAAAAALLKHENESQDLLAPIKNGFKSKNEWTRLQSALVVDDFSFVAAAMENTIQKQKESDPNKYVVRVVNHALNCLNKTSFNVK